jgi:nitrate/nitrite transporter NarK
MGAASAAAAIGFINMLGNLGGSVGPTVMGATFSNRHYATGLFIMAAFPLVSVAMILLVGHLRRDRLRTAREEPRHPLAPPIATDQIQVGKDQIRGAP